MSKRKSKIKKKIRKLKNDEGFSVNIDSENAEEIFTDYLKSEELKPQDKFDETPVESDEKQITSRLEVQFKQVLNETVDLHGFTSLDAITHLDKVIEEKSVVCNILKLKIITGRGVSSGPVGPILAREIHEYISTKYKKMIIALEASPADSMIGSTSIRGYFTVSLRF